MLLFRSRLFLKWVCLYSLLLALPTLGTGIVSFRVTTRILSEQSQQISLTALRTASQSFDRIFRDVSTLSVLLEYLPWLRNIVELSENDVQRGDRYGPTDLLKIITVLRTYRIRYPALSEISVFIKNSDMVVDCDGKFNMEEYFGRYSYYSPTTGSITGIDWNDPADMLVTDARVRKYAEATIDRVLVVHKIPGGVPTPKAVVIFQLNKDFLAQTLEQFRGANHSSIAAVTAEGQVVQSAGPLDAALVARCNETDRGDAGRISFQNRAYAYAWVSGAGNGLRYLAVTSVADLFAEADRVRVTAFVLTAAALLLGFLLAYVTTRRNFLPIRALALRLPGARPEGERAIDELAQIAASLNEMQAESKELHQRLQEFLPVARANLLHRLLAGSDDGVTAEELSSCGIGLPGARVSAAILLAELRRDRHPSGELGRAGMSALIRERVQGQLAAQGVTCYVVEHDPFEYRLVLSTDADAVKEMRPALESMLSMLKEPGDGRFAVSAVVAVGGLHEDLSGIGQALQEARTALDHAPSPADDCIIFYGDLSESVREEFAFDAEYRQRILRVLQGGDPREVDAFFDEVVSHRVMERRIGARGPYALFEMLLHAVQGLRGVDPHLASSINFNRLAALPDDAERILFCRATFRRVAAAIAGRGNGGEDVVAGIVDYVDRNFGEPAMSLTMLSEEFHLSPIYISRLFKVKTGDNFLDYLNRRRVERAKELLSSPDALIKGVGRSAGFASEVSFRRVFRKYEAMSPGEYRRAAVQQAQQ